MAQQQKELNFEDFRRATELPEYRVRAALHALHLNARTVGRATRYDAEWVEQVKQWDAEHWGKAE